MKYEVVRHEDMITLHVTLKRELEGRTEVGPVDALWYPKTKEEWWWLVLGDTETDSAFVIKRFSLQKDSNVKLEFNAPAAEAGKKTTYTLYFMSDSYMGCDQQFLVEIN